MTTTRSGDFDNYASAGEVTDAHTIKTRIGELEVLVDKNEIDGVFKKLDFYRKFLSNLYVKNESRINVRENEPGVNNVARKAVSSLSACQTKSGETKQSIQIPKQQRENIIIPKIV